MSTPTVVPAVYMYAGDTCVFPTYTFLTDTVPVDLSSYTWTAQWRLTRDSEASITLTVDATSAASGEINVLATPENTGDMWADGVWDLQGTRGAEVWTALTGPTIWERDVTRV